MPDKIEIPRVWKSRVFTSQKRCALTKNISNDWILFFNATFSVYLEGVPTRVIKYNFILLVYKRHPLAISASMSYAWHAMYLDDNSVKTRYAHSEDI